MVYEFFIDLETTGYDPVKNGIHQFGGIIRAGGLLHPQNIVELSSTVEYNIHPFDTDEINVESLDTSGVTFLDIMAYPSHGEFKRQLEGEMSEYIDKYNKLQKFHFIGYNSKFDMDFLRAFYDKTGDNYFGSWFWFPYIDVMNMAAEYSMETRHCFENFQLFTVAKGLGIDMDEDKLHNAMYDIEITMKIYDLIRGNR